MMNTTTGRFRIVPGIERLLAIGSHWNIGHWGIVHWSIGAIIATAFFASFPDSFVLAKQSLTETEQQHDARMRWWREARFGMFVHWGVYAELGGEYQSQRTDRQGKDRIAEWIKAWLGIPSPQYDKLLKGFYPVHYNPEAWVRLAKEAGMKYLVITSKHHDGFCLFDSAVTQYDVVDSTPYGKDLLAPLASACKKEGLAFGCYYSILDWHHPAQAADPNRLKDADHGLRSTIMLPGRKAEYVRYMKGQLKELVTKYDPAILWFDGEWVDWWTAEDGEDLYAYCRNLKPGLIINNRVGKGRQGMEGFSKAGHGVGDFGTPEQQIPDRGIPGVDWESCMTMNDTWGYKFYDHHWKSAETLIRNLVDTASKGGNYLLNVGPTPDGRIPEASIERLKEIGHWMKTGGESIHGSTASPYGKFPWGRCTKKEGKLYLHLFQWPNENLQLPKFTHKIQRVTWLADPAQTLPFEMAGQTFTIELPGKSPARLLPVIVLDIEKDDD